MDDYLAKPVRPEDIKTIIERWGYIANREEHPCAQGASDKNPSETATVKPQNESVDMVRLLDFADNDINSLQELVNLYLKQTSGQMEQLSAALQAGNAAEVQRLAHSCAGASATCGMIRFAPILREIENKGRERNLEGAMELYELAKAEFSLNQSFLNNYLSGQTIAKS